MKTWRSFGLISLLCTACEDCPNTCPLKSSATLRTKGITQNISFEVVTVSTPNVTKIPLKKYSTSQCLLQVDKGHEELKKCEENIFTMITNIDI